MNGELKEEPDVSVVIATRGRGELLRRAVRSIAAQEYDGHVEIIVVFDQSEVDDLSELRSSLSERVTLVTTSNSHSPGLAGGRNTGISLASGDLVAFCDDDDEWVPRKLRSQVATWEHHPDAAVISSGMSIVTQEGSVDRTPPPVTRRADLLLSRVGEIHPSSFLFLRSDLLALSGGVDEEIPASYGEDYDLLLRLTERGDIVSVQEPLVIVHWDRDSYFAGRWDAMAGGLSFLLEKHTDLLSDDTNAARMCGQVAFAHAAAGNRREAVGWLRRTLRHRVTEPRAYLAVLAMSKVVSPRMIISTLNRRGRGI